MLRKVMAATMRKLYLFPLVLTLNACAASDNEKNVGPLENILEKFNTGEVLQNSADSNPAASPASLTLEEILLRDNRKVNVNDGYASSVKLAVLRDPRVVSAYRDYESQKSAIEIVKSKKELQFDGSLYGGIEDISDEIAGVAMVLNARRIIYDGGKLDAQIRLEEMRSKAALHAVRTQIDKRAVELSNLWIELDRYEKLNDLIGSRLQILNPLINQLEKVAAAGIGDMSQVAAAQRTVAQIRVTQSDVVQRLELARVNFVNAFGRLPKNAKFDSDAIAKLVPTKVTENMKNSAPAILERYAAYQAAEANLRSIEKKGSFDLAFETKLSRPFGDSTTASDESLGLVLRKNFFNGNQFEKEEKQAKERVESAIAQLQAVRRDGDLTLGNALQTIKSMDTAVTLARETVDVTKNEISYLRKQLVIGGSTLDSVLSAEAKLYEAESKEINFAADRQRAQVQIVGALGLLSEALKIKIEQLDG